MHCSLGFILVLHFVRFTDLPLYISPTFCIFINGNESRKEWATSSIPSKGISHQHHALHLFLYSTDTFGQGFFLFESLTKKKTFHCSPLYLQFDSCVFSLIMLHLPLKVPLVCCTIEEMLLEVGPDCLDWNTALFLLNFPEKNIPLLIERPAH